MILISARNSRTTACLYSLAFVASAAFFSTSQPALAQAKGDKVAAQATAPQQLPGDPDVTTATFGDWTLRCQRIEENAPPTKVCEVSHSVQVQGQAGPVLQLAVGKAAQGQEQQFVIALPVNILVGVPPEIEIEGQKPAKASWRRCISGACLSEVDFKAVSSQLLASERGSVKFTDAMNRPLTVPFSLRGFKQALDALNKS